MPAAAPEMPRKILPPPITMQTCTPMATTSPTSAAMARDGVVIEAVLAPAHQGLTRELQQDTLVDRLDWHAERVP